ncbi:NAD(P)/FAD-dependent oxidoreductase [Candidatus Nitrospira neomarina]|uniref:NAD(P)/FAD-dependent oxidoreductase n=1 Tax=Candidatus Nitrospira neomarina TaxID=3020899 RepID=A0AA96JUW8_9BACT|nr:NAD(P)/FAD-dependent oxidoreductase [Candidatus Nitrospira neomarina]WNM61122.1 NAD(P)/FAD-dependent oxidoreductase [Candidatus Nitrospira neomarina]
MASHPVVVIGAGPAGLTAAYELGKNSSSSLILEAGKQVGGISQTVNYRDFRFDIGGHRFFSKMPMVTELWNEILGDNFLLRPRISRIHYNQHFFDYPLKATNALAGLGVVEALLVCFSYAKVKVFPNGQEENFEQWVINRFGYRLYQIFFKTYTEKVWGISCTEISADWAAQRIKNLSLKEAVRNALFGQRGGKKGEIVTSLIEQFHYPRLGPGMMWERCEELVAGFGSQTLKGMKVERIRHHHGRVDCVSARASSGEHLEFEGSDFVSTMPLRELIEAMDPQPPEKVVEAALGLRYRDYLTVVLVVNREDVFPDNWIYIHSPEVKMGRIQNYKNWSPYMVPDPSRTSLGLEYFLWDKDEEWTWSNERLIEFGTRECAQLGLINPREVEDGTVVRMEKAYPVYDHHYQDHVRTIRQYLETFSNLQTIGRNGLHRYNNQDHSMVTGVYAARNIMGESHHDVWAVNTEKAYHEEDRTTSGNGGDRMVPVRVQVSGDELPIANEEELIEIVFAKLDPVAMGVAVGTISGLLILIGTVILVLKGGPVVGPNLSLLGNFLFGFQVTWGGSLIGFLEGGVGGFAIGYSGASLRNWSMKAYAKIIRWREEVNRRRNLLD